MNPLTHEPEFVIKNKGDVTKLYHKKSLSKYYKYYDKDIQRKAAESMIKLQMIFLANGNMTN